MNIRIGAFGTEETIEQLRGFAEDQEGIQLIPFTYNHPEDVKALVELAYGCDVFLFTGPVPYMYAKSVLKNSDLPYVFVPFDQLMISNAFNILQQKSLSSIDRISIDIMHKEHVSEVLEVLELHEKAIYIYDFSDREPFEIAEIVQFHEVLWNEKKIQFALTSIMAVEKQLIEKGIPCLKMPIPDKNVKIAVQEAKTQGELRLTQTSKIIVGFVKIKQMNGNTDELDDFQLEKQQLSIHQILLRFTHEVDLSLYKSYNGYVIFGTMGSLNHLITSNKLQEYIREIEESQKVHLSIGFGSGATATEAEIYAKAAMKRAFEENVSSCYVYDESGNYQYLHPYEGPQDKREFLINQLITAGGLTMEASSTFTDFLLSRNFNSFTTQEYALYSKVTTRTAARFMKKLMETGVIQLAGEEKLYDKGRPRTIYRLKEFTT